MNVRRIGAAALWTVLIDGCAISGKGPGDASSGLPETGGPVLPAPRYARDPDADRVKTLLFITVPPDYLADRADFFGRNKIDGIMMSGIMNGWESDVWQQPTGYTPDAPAGRVVGKANPLLQKCKRANERCRQAGVRYNSLKIAFYRKLPDWFDDAGWAGLCENFRQGAVFARDAGFAGIALDVEYVSEQFQLTYPAYQAPGYPRGRLEGQSLKRGRELMTGMIEAWPEMIFWLLPEAASPNDWLANGLLAGMIRSLADHDASGGFHLCMEQTYLQTRPRSLLFAVNRVNRAAEHAFGRSGDPAVMDYWRRWGTTAIGLWPLGYYREFKDSEGKIIGYSGKAEQFGDRLVGSMADKSENYSADDFRRAFAAARLGSRSYVWLYCHGQVFWQMTPEEKARYHATESDVLPTVGNVEDYLRVLRERRALIDPSLAKASEAVREKQALPRYGGFPPRWWVAGPLAYVPKDFDGKFPPEERVGPGGDTDFEKLRAATQAVGWRPVTPGSDGYVDLKEILGKPGTPLAYAVAWVETDRARRVVVRVGTNDYGAVFVNGRQKYRYTQSRPAVADDDAVTVDLPAGRSEILMKCGDAGGVNWGFYLRVSDGDGEPLGDVCWVDPR